MTRKPKSRGAKEDSRNRGGPSLFFILALVAALLFLAWGVARIITTPIPVPEPSAVSSPPASE